jgi:gamma-glutamylcyclotransferase (GGCT)/AIG2-like uncharacterized protein YtfP
LTKRLLVYGSLRRGQGANRFLDGAKFVEEVRLPGYDMLALGWYPGIVPNPDNKEGIVGEVYEIPEELAEDMVENLDAYEGYNKMNEARSLFVRREVEVNGQLTSLYEYNTRPPVGIVEKVKTGDWNAKEG